MRGDNSMTEKKPKKTENKETSSSNEVQLHEDLKRIAVGIERVIELIEKLSKDLRGGF